MAQMNRAQIDTFLIDRDHLMKLATLTPDGTPYVNPIWYDYDGTTFLIAQKGRSYTKLFPKVVTGGTYGILAYLREWQKNI